MKIYNKKKIGHSEFLYFMIVIMPFIDIITGIVLNENIGGPIASLGKLYRFAFIFYLAYIDFFYNHKKISYGLIGFTLFLLSTMFINFYRLKGSVSEDLSYLLKLILPLYLVKAILILDRNGVLVTRVFKFFLWVYPLSFVLPKALGLGYSSYNNDSGYKGFYFANNEVNVILMVLFVYSFDTFYNNFTHSKKKFERINVIQLLCIIMSLLLIGSKTSILALAIVIIMYLVKKENIAVKLKYFRAIITAVIIAVPIVTFTIRDQLQRMAERIVWYFVRYTKGNKDFVEGVITFLCSERNLRIKPSVEHWYTDKGNEGIINFLFGIGKSVKAPDNYNIYVNPFSLIELDFFECLFWFGAIATIYVMVFYLSALVKTIKVDNLYKEKISFILVFSFSMIAGHVMISANSGTMFAIVIADMLIKANRRTKFGKSGISSNNIELQQLFANRKFN